MESAIMKKKVVLLSTGDTHGAYESIYRIGKFLIEENYEVIMIVRDKTKSDSFIKNVPFINKTLKERIINRILPEKKTKFLTNPNYFFLTEDESSECQWDDYLVNNLPFKPDLIIAGLIDGFANTTTLSRLHASTKARVFMLTVDMAPLTGGCHFSWGCEGYKFECNNCPAILETKYKDKASHNLKLKKQNVLLGDIQILSGSGWTYNQSRMSALFAEQEIIYNTNGITDTRLFNDKHRKYAKELFDVPSSAKLIFTGSWFTDDERKGLDYFVEALDYLWNDSDEFTRQNTYILVAGEHIEGNKRLQQIRFKKHLIDYIKDYRLLSLAYQASDIFVCSSIEDSGPLMVSEALSCGTPVVGFEMGIVSNMVINGYNGYKALLKDSKDLARGMDSILSLSKQEFLSYSKNSIQQVVDFSSYKVLIDIVQHILTE
jgi:glycosyltransferase involved in cell wall biosynthesis